MRSLLETSLQGGPEATLILTLTCNRAPHQDGRSQRQAQSAAELHVDDGQRGRAAAAALQRVAQPRVPAHGRARVTRRWPVFDRGPALANVAQACRQRMGEAAFLRARAAARVDGM